MILDAVMVFDWQAIVIGVGIPSHTFGAQFALTPRAFSNKK